MSDSERAVFDAAVAFVVWTNKVPSPKNYSEEYERRSDALHAAVSRHLGDDEWWAQTYAPAGWPEDET